MNNQEVIETEYPFVREVADEFGGLVEFVLGTLAKKTQDSGEGIEVLGPFGPDHYERLKKAVVHQPAIHKKYGIDHFRVDDSNRTVRGILADRYKKQRIQQFHEATPIALNALLDEATNAKIMGLSVGIVTGLDEKIEAQIKKILAEEKDIDVVFGVTDFLFQESLRCLPNFIEDSFLNKAALQARDSSDGWSVVSIPDELISRIEVRADNDCAVEQFQVNGFLVDRKTKELQAFVLRPATEAEANE